MGYEHLCNYFLNTKYITLCLFLESFGYFFLLNCSSYGSLSIAQVIASHISFNFLHGFWLQKVPSLIKFHLFSCLHILQVWCSHYFLSFLHCSMSVAIATSLLDVESVHLRTVTNFVSIDVEVM